MNDVNASPAAVRYIATIEGLEPDHPVLDLELEEGVSDLPRAVVRLALPLETVSDATKLHHRSVTLTLEREGRGVPRTMKGIVRSATVATSHERQILEVDVVSAIWLLGQTRDSRIYQDVTAAELAEEVVRELLGPQGVTVRSELTEEYPRHEYRVQHRESHLTFVRRTLHEEGIWTTLVTEDDAEVLVLCDSNDNRPTISNGNDGRVQSSGGARSVGQEVAALPRTRRWVAPTVAAVAGFDWTNPDLAVSATEKREGEPALEIYEHERIVRHHAYEAGFEQYTAHTAARIAKLQRERLALASGNWSLNTNVVSARPGEVIELVDSGQHDGRYLVLSARARGRAADDESFSNVLSLLPIELPYRPPAPAPVTMPGPETAHVVGPAGEEVHVDGHGRVRVRFSWDRRASGDERSSAWIRVSQPWAGPGHGAVFLPRVGSEVVVSYLGGDPDRPVITGSLYNGRNRAPTSLPQDKTRTGIWTSSSPGTEGHNELSFEDRAGAEHVRLRSRKDLSLEARGDCAVSARGSMSTNVAGNSATQVSGDSATVVRGASSTVVEGTARSSSGSAETVITGEDRRVVEGRAVTEIAGSTEMTVKGGEKRRIEGGSRLELDGVLEQIVRGEIATRVEGPQREHSDSLQQSVRQEWTAAAGGRVHLTSSESFEIDAPTLGLRATQFVALSGARVELAATVLRVEASDLVHTVDSLATRATSIERTAETERIGVQTSLQDYDTEVRSAAQRVSRARIEVRQAGCSISMGGLHIFG